MKRYLALAVVSFGLLVASVFAVNPLANSAQRYTEQVVLSGVAIYATLRTINAFLSTAQEVEVGGSFVVSGTLQPLKALEPLDDTVERMAGVVFAIAIGSGLLSLAFGPLVGIGSALFVLSVVLSLVMRGRNHDWVDRIATAMMKYGLVLAVVVPAAFIASSFLADRMTEKVWQQHSEILAEISNKLENSGAVEIADPTRPEATSSSDDEGVFSDILGSVMSGTAAVTGTASRVAEATRATFASVDDYAQAAQVIIARADDLVASFINILAVFLFKVIVLPVVLMGTLFGLARAGFAAKI